jgi:small subunit ribosomal protein S17
MERNRRTSLQGVVVSAKMSKTIVVEVETHKKHAKYQKRVKYSNKYYAHDEKEVAKVGDTVTIMACRPLSALKRFRLVSVDKKALEDIKVLEAEVIAEEKAEEAKAEAPKAEEKKAEVKVEAPKAEEPAKAPAKKAPAKKPAAKKAPAKKAEGEEKAAPAKKAPAKKAPAKKAE